ncbi:MAG TPA: 30S ribosomal protein S3 [Candidatus Omnitrophota bacterium]|nr:30S ribosomal protein S3 [Candidatus Omnitrophota bacterium]HNQ51385.1 30S ribosomal protein S3 [Candidatus Omnitrophota bacterium]HQO38051.1 30S ribosomal protein S3 [Candidatus Omnitrophota bacterium]HQQ05981.1 30S ribosomal protein S3 [Candidatus Omnitrophota bacterium]
MGRKIHPFLQRIGIIRTENSRWIATRRDYGRFIYEDFEIRKLISSKFKTAAVARIIIERLADKVRVRIRSARPGIIIGRHGADIEKLREDINALTKKEASIDIEEIKNPGVDAQLVAGNIANQIEKRIAFRRAVKRAVEQTMMAGAKGVKISAAGRLDGAEMCRTETYKQGKLPLSTFRADIDYGFVESLTTYGLIGIKVWIYKGDILVKGGTDRAPVEVKEQRPHRSNQPQQPAQGR